MQAPQVARNNPNASLAASLTPLSALVVWVSGKIGAHLTATQAVAVGGGIVTGGLWVGRAGGRAMGFFAKRGIVGLARMIWRGEQT